MGTSVRKMYDAELLQLDTMLARMGHAAGGAIESGATGQMFSVPKDKRTEDYITGRFG